MRLLSAQSFLLSNNMYFSNNNYFDMWMCTHCCLTVCLFLWQYHTHPRTTPTRLMSSIADTTPRTVVVILPVAAVLLACMLLSELPLSLLEVVEVGVASVHDDGADLASGRAVISNLS